MDNTISSAVPAGYKYLGTVDKPQILHKYNYLDVVDGRFSVSEDSCSFLGEKPKTCWGQNSKIYANVDRAGNYGLVKKENSWYLYNYINKSLTPLVFPEAVSNAVKATVELATPSKLWIAFELYVPNEWPEIKNYLLDTSTLQFTAVTTVDDCAYNICGPNIKPINDQYVLTNQGFADACMSAGELGTLNITSLEYNPVIHYQNSCGASDSVYLGVINKKIIMSKRVKTDVESVDPYTDHNGYVSVYSIDPFTAERTEILSSEAIASIAPQIDNVYVDPIKSVLILKVAGSTTFYIYDLDLKTFTKSASDLIPLAADPYTQIYNTEEIVSDLGVITHAETTSQTDYQDLQVTTDTGLNVMYLKLAKLVELFKAKYPETNTLDCLEPTNRVFSPKVTDGSMVSFNLVHSYRLKPNQKICTNKDIPTNADIYNMILDTKTGNLYIKLQEPVKRP